MTYYLKQSSLDELRHAHAPERPPTLHQCVPPDPALNARLYAAVGRAWRWVDRLNWNTDQWLASLTRAGHETWLAKRDQSFVGYFELQPDHEGGIEIEYLGLLPEFIGQGLGGWLLTKATARAWAVGPTSVWLHTSSFDHPAALENYQARGFQLFKTETSVQEFSG